MKRVKLGILLSVLFSLVLIGKVNASISSESIANAVNNGTITKEYKDQRKDFKKVDIVAKTNSDGGNITMTIVKEEFDETGISKGEFTYSASLNYFYDSETSEYVARATYDKEGQKDSSFFLLYELYSLYPFWAIEASDKWEKDIEPLFDKDESKLGQLQKIIDKCYIAEYGVCYTTEVSKNAGETTFIGRAENSDKAADYVIKQLQANRRSKNNSAFVKKMIKVLFILLGLYVICLSYKKERDKEDYSKKKERFKKVQ